MAYFEELFWFNYYLPIFEQMEEMCFKKFWMFWKIIFDANLQRRLKDAGIRNLSQVSFRRITPIKKSWKLSNLFIKMHFFSVKTTDFLFWVTLWEIWENFVFLVKIFWKKSAFITLNRFVLGTVKNLENSQKFSIKVRFSLLKASNLLLRGPTWGIFVFFSVQVFEKCLF